jgi:hypothetical protein
MTALAAVLRQLRLSTLVFAGASCAATVGAGCYSSGNGTSPATNSLYYPVGLSVSRSGEFLYVANSDFDLQFNGGTLQSYDLTLIRQDTASLVAYNLGLSSSAPDASFVFGAPSTSDGGPLCPSVSNLDPPIRSNGMRTPLGESCAPPTDSTRYVTQLSGNQSGSAVIGAFATDLQLSVDGTRAYVPVRGDGTLTWATLEANGAIDCGQATNGGRCSSAFQVGAVPDPLDTRDITLPGEPFAMAQTQDGTAITITQQATQETSLLLSGFVPGLQTVAARPRCNSCSRACRPGETASSPSPTTRTPCGDAKTSATRSPAFGRRSSRRATARARSTCCATTTTSGPGSAP